MLRWKGAGLLALGLGCVAPMAREDAGDGVHVGVLLPYTGDAAASGASIERALTMAAERINRAGGLAGRSVRLLARDTHSDASQGVRAGQQLLDLGVSVLIGTENADVASALGAIVAERKVPFVSGTPAPRQAAAQSGGFWFSTIPSVAVLGQGLAERMIRQGDRRIAVLHVADEFGNSFADEIEAAAASLGGEVTAKVAYDPGTRSYEPLLDQVRVGGPAAIVLVGYPRASASIIQEWGGGSRWYFPPTLKAEGFLANLPPGAANKAIGVAAAVGGDGGTFARQFGERWSGEAPLQMAYFYYDALVVWALAYETAWIQGGRAALPSGEQVRDVIRKVANGPGTRVVWYDLDEALDKVRANLPIEYCGASGKVDLDADGNITSWIVEYWSVQDDRIVTEATVQSRSWCRLQDAPM